MKIIRKMNEESVASAKRESNILGWNHENIIKILKVRCNRLGIATQQFTIKQVNV